MNASIARLVAQCDDKAKEEIQALEDRLSPAGRKKLTDKAAENYVRIMRRRDPAERAQMCKDIISELLKYYNESTKDLKNPWLETVKRPVVALDPKTGALVKRYGSIREAWRETGVYHGTIYHCIAHDRPKGYKTGGGFKWMYESEWLEKQKAEKTEE